MPSNASFEYIQAEKRYLSAQTDEEKLKALEEMLKFMPQHKSAESLRANLRQRYKKLKQRIEKQTKQKKSKKGIKKEGVQVVLVGLTNSGKSSLLSVLTNAKPDITNFPFTTKQELIGTLNYKGVFFQIIDTPAVNYETFDQGLANNSDLLLIIIAFLADLEKILPFLEKAQGKKIICFNKSDLLEELEKRKVSETLKSRKYNFVLISTKTLEGLNELKEKLLENSGVIRIYTKEPGKKPDENPLIMKPGTTIKQVAEKVLKKGIKIKEARVTGPSSKFPNQKVGIKHVLKDKDIIEFKTE